VFLILATQINLSRIPSPGRPLFYPKVHNFIASGTPVITILLKTLFSTKNDIQYFRFRSKPTTLSLRKHNRSYGRFMTAEHRISR